MNKLFVLAVVVLAVVYAAEEKKDANGPKTFKRLIPADVLRGEWSCFFFDESHRWSRTWTDFIKI